jgi:sugar phosphate isomerase/epimerase
VVFGVSPAYFLSRFGEQFTFAEMAGALPEIAAMRYSGFQAEAFDDVQARDWAAGGAALILDAAERAGLEVTQFVAHAALAGFADDRALSSDAGIDTVRTLVPGLRELAAGTPVCVPLPPYGGPPESVGTARATLAQKLERIATEIASPGLRPTVELLPGSLLTGTADLAGVLSSLSVPVGVNFDTGHAWAARERVDLVPARLASLGVKILTTHVCDHDQSANDSLAPGDGTIPWAAVFAALDEVGYTGSYDIEIRCPPEGVEREYRRALAYVRSICSQKERV